MKPNMRVVELCGGPLDGHETTVPVKEEPLSMHLFRCRGADGFLGVWAYAQSERVTASGRWALEFLMGVGSVKS